MLNRCFNILNFLPIVLFVTSCVSTVYYKSSEPYNLKNTPKNFVEIGLASYYSDEFTGRKTASGEIYNPDDFTAAHPSLPFGVKIKVTNLENGREVVVRVNDRGPFVQKRIIDLSKSSAQALGFINKGVVLVKIEIVD